MAQQAAEWGALSRFPNATQASLVEILGRLRAQEKNEVTILLLGRTGVGKSSTVNSIFNERVVQTQVDSPRPQMVSRVRAGFTLNLIDTPGLDELATVNEVALKEIQSFCMDKSIDVLLYVDRLDGYRFDSLDRQLVKAITRTFGKQIWKIAALVLTRAMVSPAGASSFVEFVQSRSEDVEKAVRKESRVGGAGEAELPSVLVENSSRCATNEEGEKILPTGDVWLVKLMSAVERIVSNPKATPVTVDQKLIDGPDVDGRGKKWIPVALLVQVFLVIRPLIQAIQDDAEDEKDKKEPWEKRAEEYLRSGGVASSQRRQQEFDVAERDFVA